MKWGVKDVSKQQDEKENKIIPAREQFWMNAHAHKHICMYI